MGAGEMMRQAGGVLARTFLGRLMLIWASATIGWTIGSLVYFGYLYVAFDPPQPGDLHVGVYLLGFLGLVVAVRMTRRWIAQVQHDDALWD